MATMVGRIRAQKALAQVEQSGMAEQGCIAHQVLPTSEVIAK